MTVTVRADCYSLPQAACQPGAWRTIVDALRWRAVHQAGRLAFRFLPNGEDEALSLTYAQFDEEVRSIAGRLQELDLVGERILILLPIGTEYLLAVLACLYAGAVPVPLPAPRPKRQCERLNSVSFDAQAKAMLTNASLRASRGSEFEVAGGGAGCQILAIEECRSLGGWQPIPADPDSIAYLQYTSGSTTSPRGVAITHANSMQNCRAIASATGSGSSDLVVSWLPFFHDMGLVGTLFFPISIGCPLVLMPPEAFIMRPIRWLRAISKFRATLSPAPNFAYDLCVQKTTPEQRHGLDLSSWRTAFNGSERISDRSITSFMEMFAPAGFRPESMRPCYGLAEATLMVTCSPVHESPRIGRFHRASLDLGTVRPDENGVALVSCGRPVDRTGVVIIDPQTRRSCPNGTIGEVWVSGPGVAAGYWNDRTGAREIFQARTADQPDGDFLSTGDLGFLLEGELYVTGRSKDLIILDGRNVAPEDLEAIAEQIDPALPPGSTIAFSVPEGARERVVLVAAPARAIRSADEPPHWEQSLRLAIGAKADIPISEFVFIHRRDLPKTTSGKKQRRLCRDLYLQGNLRGITDVRHGGV